MSIIDFFDNCRFWGSKRNSLLQKLKFYGMINQLVTLVANIILPIYFKVTTHKDKYSLCPTEQNNGNRIIVSLTSYPLRMQQLWKVIECMMRQSVKPDKIVLYLTQSQIHGIESLPHSILQQCKRGLEVRFCKDEIKSHTKYFYAFQDFPDDVVITVDDDLFYRSDLIESLLKSHKRYPHTIICNWAKEILPDKPMYKEWPDVHTPMISRHFLLLGVSGVLYPPHCMYKDIFNVSMIRELCLTADDVWLSCMALLNQTPVYFTGYKYNHLPIIIRNDRTLLSINRERNQICVDNLNCYYDKEIGIKPFVDLSNK